MFKTQIRTGLIFFLILIFFEISASLVHLCSSPITVPLDHWSYNFIERLQSKGILKNFLSNIKPYTRDEMAKIVIYVSNSLESGKISLTDIEKSQLEQMKREFANELSESEITGITECKHLIDWAKDNNEFRTRIGYAQDTVIKRGTEDYRSFKGIFRVVLEGQLKGSLFFYNDSLISYDNTNEPLPLWHPYIDPTRYPWEGVSDSYLVFRLPWADIQFGKDAVLWGPGYRGVVGLAGTNPTFDIIKLPFSIWKIKFISILGFLRDDLSKKYKSDIVRKYLSAHRIEITPYPGVCIGAQEAYIYAENLNIELINPIMVYQMAEDYLGDVGNNTMEGDIDLCLIPHTRIYGSLFLDDFHPYENFFTYGGNRWAMLGGFLIADPFGLKNFDFRTEYARVEPWVYPHKGITQDPPVPLSYKHFDTPLGHWIGPNADDLFFESRYQLSSDISTSVSYSITRKGEIGGSLYDYSDYAMLGKKKFLEGIVEKTNTLKFSVKYKFFHDSSLGMEYLYTKIHNKQKEEAKLPSIDSRKQPWKAGDKWSQNILKVSLSVKY